MRIKITFKLSGKRHVLPLNYQYPLSAWIYKVLERGDKTFSEFLHSEGFRMENQKSFKLFTFSNLQFPYGKWKILHDTDRMEVTSDTATLILAFQIPIAIEKFVAGLFKEQKAEIGDRVSTIKMEMGNIEMQPEPEINGTVRIKTLSPIVVSQKAENQEQEQYLKPGDAGYEKLFFLNLMDKHNAYQRQMKLEPDQFDLETLHFNCMNKNPKSRLQTIKAFTKEQTKVRGFLYEFEITAPAALIKTGLDSGFGAMNAQGFGCGEVRI